MARRAADFAEAHPVTDSGFTAAVTRLKAHVDQADTLALLQEGGGQREHAARGRRFAVRQKVRTQQLRRLSRIANAAAKQHPELAGKYLLPTADDPNRTFIVKARVLLDNATAQKELLVSLGAGDTFLADIAAAITEYEETTAAAHDALADHTGAAAAFGAVMKQCSDDIVVIDTFMREHFGDDPQTLEAWRSAKNVAGPFTAKSVPVTPAAPAPGATEPVAPTTAAADGSGSGKAA